MTGKVSIKYMLMFDFSGLMFMSMDYVYFNEAQSKHAFKSILLSWLMDVMLFNKLSAS